MPSRDPKRFPGDAAWLLAIRDGKIEEGVQLLNPAAVFEGVLPLEFGPPELVKPAFEVLGK